MNCQLNLQNKSIHVPGEKSELKQTLNYPIKVTYWKSKNPQCGLIDEYQLKMYSHKMKNFKSVFNVMFTSLLTKTQHLCIIWKTEAVFNLFLSLHI